jgi:23S rRNA (uracil1939-C5)-methyltransferase
VSLDCEHAARCPGCPLGDLSRDAAHARKREALVAALSAYPRLAAVPVGDTIGIAPDVGYRTRMKLPVATGGAVGLYARGTHDVVDSPRCRVAAPEVAHVLRAIRPVLAELAGARAVDARLVDGGRVMLTVALARALPPRAAAELAERLRAAAPSIASIATSVRDDRAHTVLGGPAHVVAGPDALADHALGPDAPWIYAAHGAFAQAHRGQATSKRPFRPMWSRK